LFAQNEHDEIVRLEERIEELCAKIESCRKFILASRIAVTGGLSTAEQKLASGPEEDRAS
jgi:hypothetical protein